MRVYVCMCMYVCVYKHIYLSFPDRPKCRLNIIWSRQCPSHFIARWPDNRKDAMPSVPTQSSLQASNFITSSLALDYTKYHLIFTLQHQCLIFLFCCSSHPAVGWPSSCLLTQSPGISGRLWPHNHHPLGSDPKGFPGLCAVHMSLTFGIPCPDPIPQGQHPWQGEKTSWARR